ncbi:hypothetical protein [Phenylobacterium sp. J367]|uniref:spike base protein, RCAP_Rcc01079 family n=1 Tax=Phenylobacterium sp. J367 TaxID=2898435 RepID=UPI00215188C4|nr:hypothetical protein [Phenylobacterium sp. J367]MCR5876931.1 hypothetical protein [Phenylobacterium sp. J367]MCR5876999.1 hypothetical protein [Phenylobacterium sp. J367]
MGKSTGTYSASRAVAVTQSDATIIPATRALYVGTGGPLTVTMAEGGNATFANVPSGAVLPIQVTKVLDTGTDATDIVALY